MMAQSQNYKRAVMHEMSRKRRESLIRRFLMQVAAFQCTGFAAPVSVGKISGSPHQPCDPSTDDRRQPMCEAYTGRQGHLPAVNHLQVR
jgi:hypothetical protein